MICNPLIDCNQVIDPRTYTTNVIQLIFSIFLIVAVLYFIWHFVFAAYHFIASEGDSEKIKNAKQETTYTVVGIFAVFSVFAILKLIGHIFRIPGLENLKITWPSL
jgi:uncharacterized membrane protein